MRMFIKKYIFNKISIVKIHSTLVVYIQFLIVFVFFNIKLKNIVLKVINIHCLDIPFEFN